MGMILLMVSNYFHDLAVAVLASNILAIFYVGRFLDKNPSNEIIVTDLFRKLSKITYGAFIYIISAGSVRAYFFMDFEWNPAVGKGQVSALVIKHIILFAITISGFIVHMKYLRKYGKNA